VALQYAYGYASIKCYNEIIMSKTFSAIVTEEEGGFVALNPDTDVASQGDTLDEALANLKEALELYLEETVGQSKVTDLPQATFLTTVTI
jgi:predicted RNase H-like HicB family nuclease